MPGESKTLFLFTAGYPYGTRDEPFLENEIEYLSESFNKVVIFPRHKPTNELRKTPENVFINDSIANADLTKKKRYFFFEFFFVLKIILKSAKSFKRIISFWKNYKLLLDIIAISIVHGKALQRELKNYDLENVVFYDYWFVNAIYSISYLKTKRKIQKFICRAHRYDIYEDNWPTINVSFFDHRIKVVDEVYFISKHGLEHIKNQTPERYIKKLKISYLGVKSPATNIQQNTKKEVFTIVSCARVVDFKRVHLIPSVLKGLSLKVKWVHFGDGPYFDELKQNIKKLPENIEVELMGHVSNKEVKKFYKKNKVDVLLSLSLSEGLPVSMMETLSYGIPIVAVDAGGVKEIVQSPSGLLVKSEATYVEITSILQSFLLNTELSKEGIIGFYEQNFNAEKNYKAFIKSIASC